MIYKWSKIMVVYSDGKSDIERRALKLGKNGIPLKLMKMTRVSVFIIFSEH